jgi:hypothetical protein
MPFVGSRLDRGCCLSQWVGDPSTLLDPGEDEEVRATFSSIGATYSVLAFNSNDPKNWPRLSMKTHSFIPFVVSVDYFWEREAQIGGDATKWFFCLFGKVFEIGETNKYST